GAADARGALGPVETSDMGVELQHAKFDLALTLTTTGEGVRGGLTYRPELFERSTIQRLVRQLERVLTQVVAAPELRVSQLALLDAAERTQLLTTWNAAAAPLPAEACIHTLFEAQVARTPEAVAVRCGDEALTYQALEVRANQLAHYLRGQGVGPEV